MVFGKIKKLLDSFKDNKLKQANKNLVRGLFKRKIKDFDEEYKAKTKNMTLLDRLKQGGPLFESDEEENQGLQDQVVEIIKKETPVKQFSADSFEIPLEDEHQQSYVKKHRREFSNQNLQKKYEKMSEQKKKNIDNKPYLEDEMALN